jgi:hypothetical protein
MTIELSAAQARAVAELAEREGNVTLHQLAHKDPLAAADDVYATPRGTTKGYRVARDGVVTEIGETLPSGD